MADSTAISGNENNLLAVLKTDGTFQQFLDPEFDAKTYANKIIEAKAIGEALGKLANGIKLLDEELHNQVASHHEDLLSQATGIETLEGVLQSIQGRIKTLSSSVERLQTQIGDPYNRIASRTRQLRRLQNTCDILRRVIRILSLRKRLDTQMKAGIREIAKAAQSLNELEYVLEGADLAGIQAVEEDIKIIKKARQDVEKQAIDMLRQGLDSQNQTQTGVALQVFHNLGMLTDKVDMALAECITVFKDKSRQALDTHQIAAVQGQPQGPGRANLPAPGNAAAWKAALWTRMDQLMNDTFNLCEKVFHLEKVLAKKRDPVTHVCFIEEFCQDGRGAILDHFWNTVTETLSREVIRGAEESTFLKQAFEGEYPKLLHVYNDLWSRVSQFSSKLPLIPDGGPSNSDITVGLTILVNGKSRSHTILKENLLPFENAYLAKSLSRLFDPINLVFPSDASSLPSKEELNSIVKTMASELGVVTVDDDLMVSVAKNVAKTVQLYVTKSDQLIATGHEAEQLSGGITNSQLKNTAVVNSLYQLYNGLKKIVQDHEELSNNALDVLSFSLKSISDVVESVLSMVISAIQSSLENKISRLHGEDFSSSVPMQQSKNSSEMPCSSYVQDIQRFIVRVQADYLAVYECKEQLRDSLLPICCRFVELFIRHVSLLRNVSEIGKLKLASDMAQVEFALAPWCDKITDLGHAYKLLRAFRQIIFQTPEEILENPAVGSTVPYSVVLNYLFSRAPPALKSPYMIAGWTVAEYSEWLDRHPDELDRLALIKGTLDSYAQSIKGQGNTDTPPIYSSMSKILDAANFASRPDR